VSSSAQSPAFGGVTRIWRLHQAHLDHVEPTADDPKHESDEGCLIGQLHAKGGRAGPYEDLAVVEFRAQPGARPAFERDLVCP